jgi:DNA-binding GntR family transcriptional regulator
MARRRITPQELDELRQRAAQWGKIVARQAFGEDGPGLDVDFDAMEQIAQAAAAGLTAGTLETMLEQQSAALGQQQPCPECGRACAVRRHRRPVRARGADLEPNEPVCHCPDCRRDFFPPTADPAAGRPRV